MNLTGIILEGICCTGKTTVLQHLRTSPEFQASPGLSMLCLSEHHTQRVLEPLEDAGTLTRHSHLELLNEILGFLKGLHTRALGHDWEQRGRTAHRTGFILERFHFTHVTHYPSLRWDDVVGIDRQLAALNASLILLTVDETTLRKRLFDQTRDDGWAAYLSTISTDRDAVVAHYLEQQQALLVLAGQTAMPVVQIDSAALPPEAITRQLESYWLA